MLAGEERPSHVRQIAIQNVLLTKNLNAKRKILFSQNLGSICLSSNVQSQKRKYFIHDRNKYKYSLYHNTTQDYLVLVSLKLLLLATRRKKGPSWAGLKVEGTIS